MKQIVEIAKAINGKGKVLLWTFPVPLPLQRIKGYKDYFKKTAQDIEVVDVVNDKADPSYAPTAYSQALAAHPDVVELVARTTTAAREQPSQLPRR